MNTEIHLTRPTGHPIKVAKYIRDKGYPERAARDMVARDIIIDRKERKIQRYTNLAQYFKELAFIDGLTGLYSVEALNGQTKVEPHTEGLFLKILDEAKRHQHALSAILIDLDDFKKINDTFGHQEGDVSLKTIAKLILQNMRQSDFGFRIGGDEFLLLLTETDLLKAKELATRIQKKLSENASLFKKPVTLSMGISVTPDGTRTRDDLFKSADDALYQAKKDGRNCIRTSEDLLPQQIPAEKI